MVRRPGILAEDNPVNLQGRDTLFAHKNQIADLEPQFERNLGVLKDRAGNHREPVSISTATIFILAKPMKRPRRKSVNFLLGIAARASHASRPTLFNQVLFAGLFAGEPRIKGINCFHTPKVTHNSVGVNTRLIAFAKGETERGSSIPGRATPDCDPGLPGMTTVFCREYWGTGY